MSRKISMIVFSLFTMTVFAGTAFVLTASAAPQAAGAVRQGATGLTRQGVANAEASAVPSSWVAMQPQTSLALLNQAKALGPHAADSKITLTIGLKLRNVARLKSFLEQVQNPASPVYRQYLTPREFTAEYGPSRAEVSRVTQFLVANGIEVTGVSPNRILIRTRASTVDYSHAFGIRINDYSLHGLTFFSTEDSPKLPRALASVVQNVIGLDNAVRLRSDAQTRPWSGGQFPQAGVEPPPPSLYTLSPQQVAKAYDWPSITNTANGAGVTIAIMSYASSGFAASQSAQRFWQAYGLPDHTVNVITVDGDANNATGMDASLSALEWGGAMAPGASFAVYLGATPSFSTMIDVFNKVVNDNQAAVAVTSWGHYEAAWGENGSLARTANEILMQGTAQGISFFAAAGLAGSGDGSGQPIAADFPSSSPYVTAGNGTDLMISDLSGTYGSETADASTGGGISDLFGQPSWQTGPGVPDSGWRMNSDISLNASLFVAYSYYTNSGGWVGFFGTANVPRIIGALYAIAVSKQPGKARLGQSNVLLYNDVAAGNYATDFRDITTGSNGAFEAGPGWDHPTGWGTPLGKSLVAHLGVHGPAGTLKGSVTDAASGASIAGAQVSVSPGNDTAPTAHDGSYSMLLAPGSYTVTVSDFGYTNGTATVSIADGQVTTQDIALQAAPTAKLSGRVTDASGHGYGLYARVTVTSHGFGQVATTWTNPETGRYSVSLPTGFTYHVSVAAAFDGYQTSAADVSLAGNEAKNFPLTVLPTCTAPGYTFANGGFGQDFNGNFPPAGWSVVDGVSSGGALDWNTNVFWGMGNLTGGTGNSATGVSSGGVFDTSLVTPPIPVTSLPPDPIIEYKANFANYYSAQSALDLDISKDGGATWTTISHWTQGHGGFYVLPGETVHARIGSYLPASGTVELRWRYYDLSGTYDYYAQVDDVVIGSCDAVPGGLVSGRVSDANTGNGIPGARVENDQGAGATALTNGEDPKLPVGSYVFFSTAGQRDLTASATPYAPATVQADVPDNGVVTQDFALKAGSLTSDTAGIEANVTVNDTKSESFTVTNDGNAPAAFQVLTVDAMVPATSTGGNMASVPLMTAKGHFTPASEAWARAHGQWRLPQALRSTAVTIPQASPWRDIAPLPSRISTPAGAVGPDGAVYSIGGFDESLQSNTTAIYAYHPAAGWSLVANMGIPRGAVAAAFVNGKLYIANGFVGYGQTSSLVIYDPASGKVSYGASNPLATLGSSVGVGLNGKFYVVGGCSAASCLTPIPAVQVYDPASNSWSSAPDYPEPVALLACGAISGKLYCAGGHGPNYVDYSNGYVFDPAHPDAGWTPIAAMPVPDGGLWGMAYAVGEGKLLISGGVTAHSTTVTNAGYSYDPASDSWGRLPNANYVVYRGGSACGFYRFGGFDVNDAQVASVEVLPGYTPCSGAKPIPYLTVAPASGTLAAGASQKITLTWNGAGQTPYTTANAYLKVAGATPYAQPVVGLSTHWMARPVSLVLTGSASADSVRKGQGFSYSLTVENAQADDHGPATRTVLTYALPAGVSYVAAGSSCAAPVGGTAAAPAATTGSAPTVVCDLGTIAQGASKTVTIAVKAEQAGTITGHFTATSRESNDSGKNTLDLTTTVLGTADLSASVAKTSIVEGGTGTLQLSVANAGPDTATDVHFKVTADARVKLQSAKSDQGSCAPISGANGYVCDLGDVAPGATVGIQVSAFGTYAGSATVTGSVDSSADDPNPDNNLATATVSVTAQSNGGGNNNSGGGAFAWLALVAMLGLALASLYCGQRRRVTAAAAVSHRSKVRSGMSRQTMTIVLTLFATALLLAASLAPAAFAASRAAGHDKPAGLSQRGIRNALEDAAPSRLQTMQAQTSLALLKQATKLGPHALNSTIELTVSLKLRNPEKLQSFLEQVQNPASPLYRRFLTPAQFTQRFGPSKAEVSRVVQFLKQHGIAVASVSPNRLLIHTQASTGVYEQAFGIRINDYRLDGRNFYSTSDSPRLPRALTGIVNNVIGLDNAARLHPHSHFKPLPARLSPRASGVTPPPPNLTYLSPLQIAKAYDWPSVTDTDNGGGVTIAILTYSSSGLAQLSDPHDFWAAYGLPDHTIDVIPVDGDAGDSSGMGETLLDVELSGAMAPGAKLDVYVGATPSLATTLDVMNQVVNDNPAVATTSWGLAESGWGSLAGTANSILQEAAAQGISLFAAAGDNGASDCSVGYCPIGPNNADFPSSSPYVTAANGTELTIGNTSGSYASEQAWSSTGGAVSQLFTQPDWQTGPGVPNTGWRMNSDLSLNGGPLHPYAIYENGGWYGVYGTSAVAPALAALFAVGVSEQSLDARLGQSNVLLYNDVNANSGNYATDFNDVTLGCNGQLPDGSQFCAGTGWDHPTGWGSPKATSLLSHLGIHGPAGTLNGSVTDAASGASVAHAVLVIEPGDFHTATGTDGTFSTVLPVGSYTVTVTSFGYQQGTASVSITEDTTTTQNITLTARAKARLAGQVSDASGHGYGLYALVTVKTAAYGQVATVWTDPATGKYHVKLPEGYAYSLAVSPAINGYQSAAGTVTLSGNKTRNFPLAVTPACATPGYSFNLGGLGEDFNGAWPPTGWTITNGVPGSTTLWNTNTFWGRDNWTGGTGMAAMAWAAGHFTNSDTSLVTPPIAVTSLPPNAILTYKANYLHNYGQDAFDLDISFDGGANWTTLRHWTKQHGGFLNLPGVDVRVPLSIPAGTANIELRWRYYDLTGGGSGDWYAEIDDVAIGACQPQSGGLVMGQVTDANTGAGIVGAHVADDQGAGSGVVTNPNDPNLPPSFYLFFSATGARTLTASQGHYSPAQKQISMSDNGVVVQNFALDTGELAANPGRLDVHVEANGSKTVNLKIENHGSAAVNYRVLAINAAPPATATGGNASVIRVPIKNPQFLTASLGWLRAHSGHSAEASGSQAFAPASGSSAWTGLADFPAEIADNTAARSPLTGKVYEADGISAGGMLRAAFVYDPATNLWSSIASAPVAREAPVSAFVNGKYYVFNGWGAANGDPVAEVDIYDPNTNTWSTGTPNPVPAGGGSAIGVVNGNVYIVGGCVNGACPTGLTAVQVYDPVTNAWSSAADYPFAALFPACGGIAGKLYCAGGITSPQYGQGGVQSAYVYDPATNKWSPIADIPLVGGLGGSFYAAANGELLMSAGVSGPELTNQGVAYDPKTNSWSALPNYPEAVMRGAGVCGLYAIGGITQIFSTPPKMLASTSLLPGYGFCGTPPSVPWLTVAPAAGSALAPGGAKTVALTFDGASRAPFTTNSVYLEVAGNTPYAPVIVPISVTWDPQPVSLALTGNASSDQINKGAEFTFTLTVANAAAVGHGPATQTLLTYSLPAGLSFVAANGAACTAPAGGSSSAPAVATGGAPSVVACDLGSLAQGASKTVTIAVKAVKAGSLKSHFVVSSREPDDSDKSSLDFTTAVIGTADLSAVGTALAIAQGDTGTVDLKVANAGPDAAGDVVVKLTAGAGLRLEGATSAQGSCASASSFDGYVCDLGDVASDAAVDVEAKVSGSQVGPTSLTSLVTTSANDPDQDNNVATTVVAVTAANGGNGNDNGGGGALGWLALASLLALALAAAALRRRNG